MAVHADLEHGHDGQSDKDNDKDDGSDQMRYCVLHLGS